MATMPTGVGSLIVSYGEEMRLRIPLAATSLAAPRQTAGVKLTLAGVTDLVALANDYEVLCLSTPTSSGAGYRRRSSTPSSKNSPPSSRK